MIAPILPHLKNIPGMVSLELSDLGVSNPWDAPSSKPSNGFSDQDAEALLDIFRSNPHLRKVKVNIEGMTEEKRKGFTAEWLEIWENPSRFKTPSPKEFLALTIASPGS